jgi:hypothetical protein
MTRCLSAAIDIWLLPSVGIGGQTVTTVRPNISSTAASNRPLLHAATPGLASSNTNRCHSSRRNDGGSPERHAFLRDSGVANRSLPLGDVSGRTSW